MASYQTRGRDPLFDSNTQAALERRTKELGGLAMIGAGLGVAVLLWSYSPDDPNWMLATDAPVQNWLGRFGASIAHPMTMIVGRAGWILSLALLVWGARWTLHRGEERIGRLVFAPIAIATVSVYAATVTPSEAWVHKFGMGGLFGDTVLSLILTILPVGLGVGVKLLSLGLAGLSVVAVSFCCGVSAAETRTLRGALKLGTVWLYEKVLGIAGSSAHVSVRAAGGLQARMADKLAERRARQAELRAEAQAEAQAARIGRAAAPQFADDVFDDSDVPPMAAPRLGAAPVAAGFGAAAYARPAQAARVVPPVTAYGAAPVMPQAPMPPQAQPARRSMVVRAGQPPVHAPAHAPAAEQPVLPTMQDHRLPQDDGSVFEDDGYWPTPAISAAEVAQRVAGQAAGVEPVIPPPTLAAPSRQAQRDIYGAVDPVSRPASKGGLLSKASNLLRRDRGRVSDELDEFVEAYEGEVPQGDRIKARIEDAIRQRGSAQGADFGTSETTGRKLGPRPLILESARPAAQRGLRGGEPPLTAAIAAAVAHASEHPAQTPRAMFPVPPPPPVVPYGVEPDAMAEEAQTAFEQPVAHHGRVEPVLQSAAPVAAVQAAPAHSAAAMQQPAAAMAQPVQHSVAQPAPAATPRLQAEPRAARGYVAPAELVADATPTEFYGGDMRQKTRPRSEPRMSAAQKPIVPSQLDAPVAALESFLAAPVAAQAAATASASQIGARAVQTAVQGVAAAAAVLPAVGRAASALTGAPQSAARTYSRPTARIEPTLSAPVASAAPVEAAPLQSAVQTPVQTQVQAPVQAPIHAPVQAPVQAPQPVATPRLGGVYDAPAPVAQPVAQAEPAYAEDPADIDAYGYDAAQPQAYDDGMDDDYAAAPVAPVVAPVVAAPTVAPVAAPVAPVVAPRAPLAADPRRGPAQPLNRKAIQAAAPAPKVNRFENYEFPPLDLLMDPSEVERHHLSDEALEENARLLENVLDDYGVKGEIVSVRPGPVVTMYELEPAPGLKASRVIGLADDIARSMSALSARVSTVPGRSVIGIELPNSFREKVVLREIISARDFGDSQMRLPLALGKDIAGEPVVANLAKMPHLLIAGTTGSGKSVAINTMILSLLYKLTPEECRLIMIDPKMLELSVYDGIPHLLSPVVTDPKKAVVALKWVVGEMEERYRKMSKMGVRNIEGYNGRVRDALAAGETFSRTIQTGFDEETGDPIWETDEFTPELLPYIVVIVDEMADLMMVAGKEIEACIQRLAQMARASGIHLIMATQRPSVDVITGTIKANFPTRISFQVTSKIDSRTILGEQGAEQLLGMGDMLYMAGGGRVTRIHGPFCSDGEVEEVVSFLKSYGPPDYKSGVTEGPDEDAASDIDAVLGLSSSGNETEDAMYDMAVQIVARDRKCSTSYIQRKLAIGYNKAARLVEQMEANGVVSAANAVGKREILVPEVH